ncbi:MAG: OadG family transporter subunit [Dehalococcoidia bacterium]
MEELDRALLIAGVGIGVVFLSLVLLALILQGLNRFVVKRGASPDEEAPNVERGDKAPDGDGMAARAEKEQAAAIAVALALAEEGGKAWALGSPVEGPKPTPWKLHGLQEQMRSRHFGRGPGPRSSGSRRDQ